MSAEVHRWIVDQAQAGIWLIDAQGRTTLVNKRLADMLGHPAESMLGRSIFDFMDEEGERTTRSNMARRAAGIRERHPFRFVRSDGQNLWTTLDTGPLHAPDGTYLGALAFVADVTERHHDDEALLRSLYLMRAAIEQVPAGIAIAMAPDGLVSLANEAAVEIVAEDHASLPGVALGAPERATPCHRPDGRPYSPEEVPLQRALKQGERVTGEEVIYQHPDGGKRVVLCDAAPVRDDEGTVLAGVAVLTDITQRRRMEQEQEELSKQVLQTQRLDSLSLLAGGIAHNFNNQLATVLGRAELALMHLEPDSPTRRHIEHAVDAAEQAARLTRRMLAYAGRSPFDMEHVSVGELLGQSAELIRHSLPAKVTLDLGCQQCEALILADRTQMDQLLTNLVWNAVEASGGQATAVKVRARRVRASPQLTSRAIPTGTVLSGDCVLIEVIDQGEGIPSDSLGKVFDPYFTTRPGKHGLGLSAVLGIVRGHRGCVRLDSEPGVGTTVAVWLPECTLKDRATGPDSNLNEGRARVLVVDDDPGVLEMLAEVLRAFGYAVETAPGGQPALTRLRGQGSKVDLMLLDMAMPDLSGDKVAEALQHEGLLPPFCVISGYSPVDVARAFSATPPRAVLQKPLRPAALIEAIERMTAD